MRKLLMIMLCVSFIVIPVNAMEYEPPVVPNSGELYMPEDTESFGEGLWFVIRSALDAFLPEISQSMSTCITIIAAMILISFMDHFPGTSGKVVHFAASIMIGVILLNPSGALIRLGQSTISEMTDYGKLLLPVLTGAMAAQGGTTTSSALYVTTMFFVSVLSTLITRILVPMLYVYFCLTIVQGAFAEETIGNLKSFMKWLISWSLKIVLYVFTGFIGITGVVSGSADAAAVKAMKLTISGMVPVVGGIISDASETILVSASLMKNAAGIYGILALFAVAIGPFLKIGSQYLMLKVTAAICSVFSAKQESELLKDFSGGMGMLLAMAGTVCLLLLISVFCFLKGVT